MDIIKALTDRIPGRVRRTRADSRGLAGTVGFVITGGRVATRERNRDLIGTRKFTTFDDLIANVPVIGAGVRYITALAALSKWTFDGTPQQVDRARAALMEDPRVGWNRIIRRASMYLFNGFSAQEWSSRRRDDGILTFDDVQVRPVHTIEEWQMDRQGRVVALIQRDPNTPSERIAIPRRKCLYLTDDTATDSPEGLGMLRQLVLSAQRFTDYAALERLGVVVSTGGTPVLKWPKGELEAAAQKNTPNAIDVAKAERALNDFIRQRVEKPELGVAMDSEVWSAQDEAGRPTMAPKWDLQLLSVQNSNLADVGKAIERVEREMARVMGIEALLLGGGSGSYALAREQGDLSLMTISSMNQEIGDAVHRDMLIPIFALNGWGDPPRVLVEHSQRFDPQVIADTLKALKEGTVIKDPAYNEVRAMMGVSEAPDDLDLGPDPMNDDPPMPGEDDDSRNDPD